MSSVYHFHLTMTYYCTVWHGQSWNWQTWHPNSHVQGFKEEYRSTNDVEHEFWVCLDDIKHCMSGNKKKYVLD